MERASGTVPALERTPADIPGQWRFGRKLGIALIILATLAYYFWTAILASGGAPPILGEETDHFNLLSRGFKKGQLHLDGEVPIDLIQSPNPYDPALRKNVPVLHDASYYRGKYYIYFGPAPVVTLLLPFSVMTERDLPLPYAVWFFSSAGYLALAGAFLFLQRRHYPAASLCTTAAGLIAIGGASMVVTLLRRGNVWELSAASGFCYFSISLLCLVRALHSSRATAWAMAGGLALGLAVASRPPYIVCSALFALPLLVRALRKRGESNYGWRALLGAAASCGLPVAGLLAYNYARFQNPLEFGMTYQLTSVIESESRHFSLEYVGFNFRLYFLAALRWIPFFPFANGIAVPPLPLGHGGHEYTFGILPNLPFSWFTAGLLASLATRSTHRELRPAFWTAVGVIAAAGMLNAGFLLCFFGSCIRYMVDFTPSLMLLASLGLFEAEAQLSSGVARGVLRGSGLALALFSSAVAGLAVVNFYDSVQGVPPVAYRPAARALNLPYFWLQQQRWPNHQPQEMSLTLPADRSVRQESLVSVTRGEKTTAVFFVEYLDETKIRFGYREPGSVQPVVLSPAVAAPAGAVHTLRISIGGPYSDFDGLKGRLRAQFDHIDVWDLPTVSFGTYPGNIVAGEASAPSTASFTGRIHAQRAVTMAELARPPVTGIRVRITFATTMAGRSFPLLTTGRAKAGDILFVQMHQNGTISFGYDHWGDALLSSPAIPVAAGETRVVEFWAPAISPAGNNPELLVKVDGSTIWQHEAPAFPYASENLFVGSNPIGGSTCEPVLENGVFEQLDLPAPRQ